MHFDTMHVQAIEAAETIGARANAVAEEQDAFAHEHDVALRKLLRARAAIQTVTEPVIFTARIAPGNTIAPAGGAEGPGPLLLSCALNHTKMRASSA